MNLYRFDDNEDKKIISKDTENTQNIKMNLYSFDDRVKYWVTFNEAWTFTVLGYGTGTKAPGN